MPRYINIEDITLKGVAVFDENLDVLIPLSDVRKALLMTPAADVVEVVRCKDCSYCKEHHYEEEGEKPYIKLVCKWSNYSHQPNDFCSYGERKK